MAAPGGAARLLTDRPWLGLGLSAAIAVGSMWLGLLLSFAIDSLPAGTAVIGVATAAGVLIDAFIVRALLVPSLMALLGRWNWWSPRPLARLHARVGISEATT